MCSAHRSKRFAGGEIPGESRPPASQGSGRPRPGAGAGAAGLVRSLAADDFKGLPALESSLAGGGVNEIRLKRRAAPHALPGTGITSSAGAFTSPPSKSAADGLQASFDFIIWSQVTRCPV